MGRSRERNGLINKTALSSRDTQDQIANAIALNLHPLDRTAGVKATESVKPIPTRITSTINPAQAGPAASPLHSVHPAAKTLASLDLSTSSWSLKGRQ